MRVHTAVRRISLPESASLLAIAILIVQVGFIAGVLIGVIIGCATFAVSASRVNAIKFSFDGSEYRSSLDRGPEELRILADHGREIVLRAGESHTVRPGVPHGFTSHGEQAAITRVVMDRPGRMAEFLETFYELNRTGRTDSEGKPSFPQIAVTFVALRHDIRTVVAPWPVQLALFATLGPIGRLRGLKPFYTTHELRTPPS